MVSESLKNRFPASHRILLDNLAQILNALSRISEPTSTFHPTQDLVTFYNGYIDFALSIYVDKFKQLYEALTESLEREWYVVYAQLGRSIIENTATLLYYANQKELSDAYEVHHRDGRDEEAISRAIQTLDRFIRGNRFSWDAFVEGRFDELTKTPHQEHLTQKHVQTCLDHWFRGSPKLESLYNLLCDLVHPNFGSNILVTRALHGELVAGGAGGNSVSLFIICPTLAGIVGAYKDIQHGLLKLERWKLANERDGCQRP